ncbi:hypothetical protein EYF80_025282 [Liparis tanakae]|uniref:Uncharacterized protein n=1 Tax=Liparis tanakae TaxID=230148 RepID=A0A4Z2HI00_9TELE|nr:hypothetical protein EYF80_025282 [Liparis tanakae]
MACSHSSLTRVASMRMAWTIRLRVSTDELSEDLKEHNKFNPRLRMFVRRVRDAARRTCEVMRRNTRRVSASQFFCWAMLAEIWPRILMLSPSFQPRTFTWRTLRVFSGPFSSTLMTWWSPPGSSLVTQPM